MRRERSWWRWLVLAATLPGTAFAAPAHGPLFQRSTLAWFGGGAGVSGADIGFRPFVASDLSFGALFGEIVGEDDLGRLWGVGVRVRNDIRPGDPNQVRTAPMLEVRRELDILIFGVHGALLAGPLLDSAVEDPTRLAGGTVRLAGGARVGHITGPGLSVRLEAGVDVAAKPTASLGLFVGFEHRMR